MGGCDGYHNGVQGIRKADNVRSLQVSAQGKSGH
jgi:hypothetical protein